MNILKYDLVIIGAGSAGLTAAQAAVALGARVALIEGHRTGGECTWTGCIPSKTLLAVARQVHAARNTAALGIRIEAVTVDFSAVMAHVRRTIEQVYDEESPDALRTQGVDVYEAYAQFTDPRTVHLSDGTTLQGKYFLICTGASPHISPGFQAVPYLTSETLFDLTSLPRHLLIVGGGPVGTEMAQAFRRLGSQVTLISRAPTLLPRDDPQASSLIADVFRQEGVNLRLGIAAISAHPTPDGIEVVLEDKSTLSGDQLLLATGKQPHIASLNLEAAGVATSDGQLVLDDRLRTSQRHILAAGDVTGGPQFTHYAGWQAFQAVQNALLPLSARGIKTVVPWTTFTDPEIAQAGLTEVQARQRYGDQVQVTQLPMSRADRAMTEGKSSGFMKLIHQSNGRLLGATIVGLNASEMMNDWIRVLEKRERVWNTASAMRVYPSLGTANVILATEQIKHQLASGWLGRVLRGVSRLK
jgi:pyruvate/2-oxoglutarate dehydrogenase complex dihydrolipoamide dehydrogenase (E3) component